MEDRVPVKEIMTTELCTLEPIASVEDAAAKMVEVGAGCVIVSDEGHPVGIVTERDIVRKVVSERKNPSDTQLRKIMSSPIVWVAPHTEVLEAARQMAKLRLRRLVVMREGEPVGVLTVQNILFIAPHLIEVTRELASIECGPGEMLSREISQASGYCESCRAFSDLLESLDGELLCPECKERRE
jgi:CBS domain-containing protein